MSTARSANIMFRAIDVCHSTVCEPFPALVTLRESSTMQTCFTDVSVAIYLGSFSHIPRVTAVTIATAVVAIIHAIDFLRVVAKVIKIDELATSRAYYALIVTAVYAILHRVTASTFHTDWRVSNNDASRVFTSENTGQSAVIEILIIAIMRSLRPNVFFCLVCPFRGSPEVRKLENFGKNLLHDVPVWRISLAITVVVLRVKSALNQLFLSTMEHLTVDLWLLPIVMRWIVFIRGIENHRCSVKHIAHRSGAIHPTIGIRHIPLVMLVYCVTTCPAIAEAHCKIIKRID